MAAVHFTTIPSEPNTANYTYQPRPQGFSLKKWVGREKGKALGTRLVCVIGIYLFFGGGGEIRPSNSNIAYPRFEVYKTFLRVYMRNFMVFMR